MGFLQKISFMLSSGNSMHQTPRSAILENAVNLIPGQKYTVKKEFSDYDKIIHPAGETWVYMGTSFLPYEDGLTLHLTKNSVPVFYRLEWRKEEQATIIDNFTDFVKVC